MSPGPSSASGDPFDDRGTGRAEDRGDHSDEDHPPEDSLENDGARSGEASARHPTARAPATGSDDYWDTELHPSEEPVVTGTLFLVIILMMIIGAVWVILYLRLLER